MDKKFVRIDDVFKHNLQHATDSDGLEHAWKKMEGMLDDNQRTFGGWLPNKWMPTLLIFIIVGVGGSAYFMNNDSEANLAHNNKTFQNNNNSINALNKPHQKNNSLSTIVTKDDDINKISSNDIQPKKLTQSANTQTGNNLITTQNKNSKQIHKTTDVAKSSSKHIDLLQDKSIAQKVKINDNGTAEIINDLSITNNHITNNSENSKTAKAIRHDIENQNILVTNDQKIVRKVEKPITEIQILKRVAKPVNDGFTNSDLAHNNDKVAFINDTQSIRQITKIDLIPLAKDELKALQSLDVYQVKKKNEQMAMLVVKPLSFQIGTTNNTIALSAAAPITAAANMNTQTTQMNTEYAEQSILTAINNFFQKRTKFYASFTLAGILPPSDLKNPGFRLGTNIHYWLGETVSADAGLAYLFRPINKVYEDVQLHFNFEDGIPVNGGYLYNYDEMKTVNKYDIKNINTLIMPVTITYLPGNHLYFTAGADLFYQFPLHYRKTTDYSKQSLITFSTQEGYAFNNKDFKLRSTDFDQRVGVGYTLGVGYQFNRNLGIYSLFSHPLIINANTTSNQQVFKETYGQPYFQIGLKYNIGKSKRVMYLMDKPKR